MTTIFKKAVALFALVAVALVGAVAVPRAYAAGTGKLTVTSSDAGFSGAKVDAWKMFDVTKSGDTYTYTVADDWKAFFKKTDAGYPNIAEGDDFDAKAADYVRKFDENNEGNKEATTNFAKLAAAWAKANNISATKQETASGTPADRPTSYVATFSDLDLGYYLVKPYASVEKDNNSKRNTDAILISVVDDKATIALKNTYPTVDKKVENGKGNGAQVGDTVKFTLTSAVPDTSEFDHYTFQLVDKLSNGLTFNNDDQVKVTVGDTELTKSTDYILTDPTAANQNTVTFDLSSYIKPATGTSAAKAGDEITVTYTATLNEKAVTDLTGNGTINSAKVVYTNGPTTNDKGESTPSETHTYTFGFDLKKVDGDGSALGGAKFQLWKANDAKKTPINFVLENGVYRVATATEIADTNTTKYTEIETPSTDDANKGIIKFSGLDDGSYVLHESQAPQDYNTAADTTVTITATYDQTSGKLLTHNVSGLNNGYIQVVNRKGTLLPSTGGMGTIAFTVVGAVVVIAGVAWTVARRRHEN